MTLATLAILAALFLFREWQHDRERREWQRRLDTVMEWKNPGLTLTEAHSRPRRQGALSDEEEADMEDARLEQYRGDVE